MGFPGLPSCPLLRGSVEKLMAGIGGSEQEQIWVITSSLPSPILPDGNKSGGIGALQRAEQRDLGLGMGPGTHKL